MISQVAIAASGKSSCLEKLINRVLAQNSLSDKCTRIAQKAFSEIHFSESKAIKIYVYVKNYLEKHENEITISHLPQLQKLLKCIQKIQKYVGDETDLLKATRVETEQCIHLIECKLKFDNLIPAQRTEIQQTLELFGIDLEIINDQCTSKIRKIQNYLAHWQPKTFALIMSQSLTIPIIQEFITSISTSCAKIDEANAKTKKLIYNHIYNQLFNIEMLARFIDNLTHRKAPAPISQAAISRFSLSEITYLSTYLEGESLVEILQPLISGEKLFKTTEFAKFQHILSLYASEMENSVTFSPQSLKELSDERPISSNSLVMQANLHSSIRNGKIWAAGQNELIRLGKSQNRVFELKDPEEKVVAYYKESRTNLKNVEILEQLLWDTAVIFGVESMFAPTARTFIRSKNDFMENDAKISELAWDDNGKSLTPRGVREGGKKGSIQSAQNGISLLNYETQILTNPDQMPIPFSQLIKGSLVIAVMGFFDAHRNNILIDLEGNIKFYDNTGAMPHSNGCFLWGGVTLRSSFRSGLLHLSESHTPLNHCDWQLVKDEIENYKTKFPILVKFYNHERKKLASLPPDWLNVKDSLKAMWERIISIEAALQNPNITTLCELSLASQPNLRFNIAVTYLAKSEGNPYFLSLLDNLGAHSIRDCIIECYYQGLNLNNIKEICDNPNLSFIEMMNEFTQFKWKSQFFPTASLDERYKDAIDLLQELISVAKQDNKDW